MIGHLDTVFESDDAFQSFRRNGDIVPDKAEPDPEFTVKLPDEQIGMAMVIRSFEKMSYALIMEADMPISVKDYVESP